MNLEDIELEEKPRAEKVGFLSYIYELFLRARNLSVREAVRYDLKNTWNYLLMNGYMLDNILAKLGRSF